jgi:Tetrapyrrole (Corrin/Porphyrin) Methylases
MASRSKGRIRETHSGHLTVVGVGIKGLAQITAEALLAIQQASLVFHAAADPATARWIAEQSVRAKDLTHCFRGRRSFRAAHEAMVLAILAALDRGERVCAAFYGSPSVGVYPAHRAIELARRRGHAAVMLPGISADACLLSDLPLDPLASGYQTYDATDFVLHERRIDSTAPLVLWQIGLIGGRRRNRGADRRGIHLVQNKLVRVYGARHRAAVYVASTAPGVERRIDWCELRQLSAGAIGEDALLFVPPRSSGRTNRSIAALLQA